MHYYAQHLTNARSGQRTFALLAIIFTLGAATCAANGSLILAALFAGLGLLSVLAVFRFRAAKRKWRDRLETYCRITEDAILNTRKR